VGPDKVTMAAKTAALVDRAAEGPVLVFGSLPPTGRDLDLLARPRDEAAIAGALEREGYQRRGRSFAVFGGCTSFGVELLPVSTLRLQAAELDCLFAQARPIAGLTRLARPAPHHALLLLARRVAWGRAVLEAKLRKRVAEAVAERPSAWSEARAHAPAWRAERALALLESSYRRAPISWRERGLSFRGLSPASAAHLLVRSVIRRRPRHPVVVALSGLDGAGKSSQACALRDALLELDVDTAVVWSPLGGNLTLELIARPLKRLLRSLRIGPFAGLAERSASGHVMSNPERQSHESGPRLVTHAWATLVMVLNFLSQRRAVMRHALGGRRVVVFDRHVLDSVVRRRFLYGVVGSSRFQLSLVNAIAPKARLAYVLEIRPETAFARKPDDWTLDQLRRQAELYKEHSERLGVPRLDGELPRDELCTEIATEVWRALR
jgi:thymidylate kinase